MSRVVIRMLPDKSGRVCIHYFVHDVHGVAQTPGGRVGMFDYFGSKGFIACQPRRSQVTPRVEGGVTYPVCHSNEARAVTCPKCKESTEWNATMALIESILDTAQSG